MNDFDQQVAAVTDVTGHDDGSGRITDNYVDKGAKHRVLLCKFISVVELEAFDIVNRRNFHFVMSSFNPANFFHGTIIDKNCDLARDTLSYHFCDHLNIQNDILYRD